MAIDTEALPCAKLEKIYRQQNAPQLLEIIEDYYAQRYDAALEKIEGLGLIRENNTRTDSLQQLVADVIQEFKRGQNPLVISPIHRDGKAFAETLRAIRPGQGRSAIELMDGVAMPRNDSAMGHYEKELRQEPTQKDPSLASAQAAHLEKEVQQAPHEAPQNPTAQRHRAR